MKPVHIFVLVVSVAAAAKLPSFIDRCDLKQADVKKCLINACQNALMRLDGPLPEVGLPNLEPFDIPALSVGAGKGGAVNVDQNFKDVHIFGLSKTQIENVEFDFDKNRFIVAGFIPELKMTAQYALNGKVLLLPIVGEGPSTVVLERVHASIVFPFDIVRKKGKRHIKASGTKLVMDPEHVTFNFENLFNGDKALGDNINNVLNDNWKEVWDDVKAGYDEAYSLIVESLANGAFAKVPVSEVFLNEED